MRYKTTLFKWLLICCHWGPLWLPFRQCKRCSVENTWKLHDYNMMIRLWNVVCYHAEKTPWSLVDKKMNKYARLRNIFSRYPDFLPYVFLETLRVTKLRCYHWGSLVSIRFLWGDNSESFWVSAETTHKTWKIFLNVVCCRYCWLSKTFYRIQISLMDPKK